MYTTFYGFSESPFSVTPDPKFLYLTPSHRDALAHLEYGIREGKGFVVLTGEVGLGKTTVLRAFLERVPENVVTAMVLSTNLSFKQLLYLALRDFGADPEPRSKAELLALMHSFLLGLQERRKMGVLILDEAQNLSTDILEEFRLLSNLETSTHKLLQIVFVGQPELKSKLNLHRLRQLRQRIPGICDLSPLDGDDVRRYVEHRLRVASGGREPAVAFSDEVYDWIAAYSHGVPRLVNQVCDRALLIGYVDERSVIARDIVLEAIRDLERGSLERPVRGRSDSGPRVATGEPA
jgi:general secretion pathway protein A